MTSTTRTTSTTITVERLLAIVSAVLLPLGLAVILLGWAGAAHSSYLFEQVPYLISGGLFGLGLVFVGGLVYVASMMARNAAQQQRQGEEVVALLRDLRDGLQPTSTRTVSTGSFVATAKGGMLHRPDCTVVAGRGDLRQVSGTANGLSPCTLCAPFDVAASVS